MILAYHNDPKIKQMMLDAAIAHRRADMFVGGHYYAAGRVCHLGCCALALNQGNLVDEWHLFVAERAGWPLQLCYLQEHYFESLYQIDRRVAALWSETVIDAIPVGADLMRAYHAFMAWLMIDPEYGCINFTMGDTRERDIAARLGELFERSRDGVIVSRNEWLTASNVLLDASALSDWEAARAALWEAARVAGRVALAEKEEGNDYIQTCAKRLIIELANAPVPGVERPRIDVPEPVIRDVTATIMT